ncbi:G-protein coupled receptor 143-like [Mizuhopecten yessoensis]|uniref:G-protein coupled receptors family 1 profile domain-containing protein n=1 Tax=Mizuhopecten yessoensis TaxID=6573 RepID=A0A210R5L8_MIZYE|nr:G-protein coupled receptor 143-like [Mizuhopecten yessoensis]OWF56339.1 hypothetical protein KP79_PYT08295 [Mizuhopecten yessoensis]
MASLHDSSFYCITEAELPPENRLLYTVVSLLSASLGIFGSSWQIITYAPETQAFMRRENSPEQQRRQSIQPNPVIVLFLALTNLTSCIGSVLRSVATYLVKPPAMNNTTDTTGCHAFVNATFVPCVSKAVKVAGGILEAFTDFSYVASALWTLSFAINIHSQLAGRHVPLKVFHLLTWSVASGSVIAGLAAVYSSTNGLSVCAGQLAIFGRYMSTYIPMALSLVMICVLYWKASISVSLSFTRLTATVGHEEQAIIQRLRIRFFWIVFFFALCWLPNLVDSFFHIDILSRKCMEQIGSSLFPLWIIEALLNPLQGLFNCFLYGRKCSCRPFVYNARTRRHYTQIPNTDTDRSFQGLLNNPPNMSSA